MADLQKAVDVLKQGGVIAYPTEYCFGLGCDPLNVAAIKRILAIKRRQQQQGLILIAAEVSQLSPYADVSNAQYYQQIIDSWPGPFTWLLTAKPSVSKWVRGAHRSVAVRVTNHAQSRALCQQFGHVIISTSANRHGEAELMTVEHIEQVLGDEVDYIVEGLSLIHI